MQAIQQFFWLICGAWAGIGSAGFLRYRLRGAVSEGTITKQEADRFAAGVIGWHGGPCLILWVLQFFFAQTADPDFLTWGAPYGRIAGALCVLLWIIAFTWIWFFGGDRKLSRIYTLGGYHTYLWKNPIAFRILILLAIVAGVVGVMQHEGIQ